MASLVNIARVYTSTVGLGSIEEGAVVPGFRSFTDALEHGETYSYAIEAQWALVDGFWIPTAREVGRGVWNSVLHTLSRSVLVSTLGEGMALSLGGDAQVFISGLAEDFVDVGTTRVVTDAGTVTIDNDDTMVVINKAIGAATTVNLPAAADKVGPVTIKDGKGDAGTNTITIDGDGAETIDGAATRTISFDYGAVTLNPYPDGSGWFRT